jgi:hypothetical protein
MEGCSDQKRPHSEKKALPSDTPKSKTVITGLIKANKCSVMFSAKNKPRYNLNVQSAMWGCKLTWIRDCNVRLSFNPPLGSFTPNHISEDNTSKGKANYTIVSTIFHCVLALFEYQYTVSYNKSK